MRIPNVIREQLDDLERRFTGPIPNGARFMASLPAADRIYAHTDVDAATGYCEWLCQSRIIKWRGALYWANGSAGCSGLQAAADQHRFEKASRQLNDAFVMRQAWAALQPNERQRRAMPTGAPKSPDKASLQSVEVAST